MYIRPIYLVYRVQYELVKPSIVTFFEYFGPFLFLWIIELIAPQPLHQLGWLNFEFFRVDFSKLFHSESPTMKTRAKTNSTFCWINLFEKNPKILPLKHERISFLE